VLLAKGRFTILMHVEAHLCRKDGLADHGHSSVEMAVPKATNLVKNKKDGTDEYRCLRYETRMHSIP
jgi:hypothetical protein